MEHTRRCRILLVEDHADTRDLLVRLLSRSFQVEVAGCFSSALAAAERATPDLVITDLGLPGRDGVEVMREIRQRYGIPGIAVTGHPIDDPEAFRSAGFCTWLRKPIRFDELFAAISSACAVPAS